MVRAPRLDEVWLASLDPTQGSEIRETRPCLVVSPDEMNRYLHTVIVAPMTTAGRRYPTRVSLRCQCKHGHSCVQLSGPGCAQTENATLVGAAFPA